MKHTNEQILKKAIEKAVKSGWNGLFDYSDLKNWCKEAIKEGVDYRVIFSHSFAKAFWGAKDEGTTYKGDIVEWESWQRHLAEMVLEEDPLQYLTRFLENECNNSKN